MTPQRNYWEECLSDAAESAGVSLTAQQLTAMAEDIEYGHDNYGMAFHNPAASERLDSMKGEWAARVKALEKELATYRDHAETAIKQALGVRRDGMVSIGQHGEVSMHGGRTERIQ